MLAHATIGQFFDMMHLFSLTGMPSDRHCLLMNGDLVDRGSWSIEVIITAFALKCENPVADEYGCLDNFLKGCTRRGCTLTGGIMRRKI
jgi:hypothetical protein